MKSLTYGDMPEHRTEKPEDTRGLRIRIVRIDEFGNLVPRQGRDLDGSWEHMISRRLALFKLVASQF